MTKKSDETIEIKEFPGIDRSSDGTVVPPNRFFTTQNLHPIGAGELQKIPGVVDESGSGLPGVGKIISQKFMKDAFNNDLLLCFYHPSASLSSWTPNVSSSNFAASGTTYTVDTIIVTYVGPGGYPQSKQITPSFATATTITFTIPNDVPDWVAQIDIYAVHNEPYYRIGSLRRTGAGTFPSSIVCSANPNTATDTSITDFTTTLIAPDSIFSTQAYIGLPGIERWYFGVAPKFTHTYFKPRVSLVDSGHSTMGTDANAGTPKIGPEPQVLVSEVQPSSGTLIEMRFPFAASGTYAMTIGDAVITSMYPFAGKTPEDLTLVTATNSSTGICQDTQINLESVSYTASGASISNNTVAASPDALISFRNGDRVVYVATSGSIGGLTTGVIYWVRNVDRSNIALYASYADYVNDLKIDITSYSSGTQQFFCQRIRFFVDEQSIRNSRNNVHMTDPEITTPTGGSSKRAFSRDQPYGDAQAMSAIDLRTDGYFINQAINTALDNWTLGTSAANIASGNGTTPFTVDNTVGCWVIRQFPFSLANAHQLLPGINERTLSQTSIDVLEDNYIGQLGYGTFWNPVSRNTLVEGNSEVISVSQFRNRVFTANGNNVLWYTNGYVWKASMRNNGGQQVPQSRYVQGFSDRLVSAGGKESIQNSNNVFYYSDAEDPFAWGTTAVNVFTVFSKGPVNGLGTYSQQLLNTGYAHFLIVSKLDSLFVWDGTDTNGPQQIYFSFGFAGPRAFALTDYGPIMATRSNLFFLQGTNITEVGAEVKSILRALTDTQLHRVQLTYQNRVLKIGYPSGAGSDPDCDREIWLEFRTEEGQLQKYISGPHTLTPFYDMDSALTYNQARDVRASCSGAKPYQRDLGLDDAGANINAMLILSRMGGSKDLLRKILTQFDVAVKLGGDETINLILDSEDGSVEFTGSKVAQLALGPRYLFQYLMSDRFLGRINQVTLSASSKNALSIFNLTAHYRTQKRTTMRF